MTEFDYVFEDLDKANLNVCEHGIDKHVYCLDCAGEMREMPVRVNHPLADL